MTYIVTQACIDVKDRTCITVCPVDCIYEGGRMLYVHPDECIDCGACEPVCPQNAIYYAPDAPDEVKQFEAINGEFFGDIGSPGGSTDVDLTDRDHPAVADYPAAERIAPASNG